MPAILSTKPLAFASKTTTRRVRLSAPRAAAKFDEYPTLDNGAVREGPSLAITSDNGRLKMPNPFVIGSGPPGTNYKVMKKAFEDGWGGVIAKTVSTDSSKVINVTPRYARMKNGKDVIGWQNIELISDRPLQTMLDEFKMLKDEFPDRCLIASIMEEYNKDAWEELIERCEEVGVDAFEVNFSCPHGMPERKMGAAMGQDTEVLENVVGWIMGKANIPVWAKMTPNITDITVPARVSLEAGADGLAAINTIVSVMGINLKTLRPEPCVEGYSTPGGYSSRAVKPIALARVMALAKLIREEFDGKRSLSGIGGVETGADAAEMILLGADTVQVCTGVMVHGYPMIRKLCAELQDFMKQHNFQSLDECRGASLPYFTTHTDLVKRQKEALEAKRSKKVGLGNDKEWTGDGFVNETEQMVSN